MLWIISLVLFAIGVWFPLRNLLDNHDWKQLQEWQEAAIYSLGKYTGKVRRAGLAFTFWWERMRIADTRVFMVDIPLQRLSTGGNNAMEFDVDMVLYGRVTDVPIFTSKSPLAGVSTGGSATDPQEMAKLIAEPLCRLVRSAVTSALNRVGENVLMNGGLADVLTTASTEVIRFCKEWGLGDTQLKVEDLGLPVALLEAAAAQAKAEGDARAMDILAKMRLRVFNELKTAQGEFFIPLANLEALKDMAGKGSFRVVGNMGGMGTLNALGTLGTLIGADLLDKEAAK